MDIYANVTGEAGAEVTVTDASGTVVATFTARKQFGNVVFSSEGIATASSYTVSVSGGSSTTVTAGEGGTGGMGGPGGGGMGGRPR